MAAPEPSFEISAVAAVVVAFGGFDAGQRHAVLARIKQMCRLGFPDSEGIGRGFVGRFGTEDLAKVVLVISLLEASMPTTRAVEMARAAWPGYRDALAVAWSGGRGGATISVPAVGLTAIGRRRPRIGHRRTKAGGGPASAPATSRGIVQLRVDCREIARRLRAALAAAGLQGEDVEAMFRAVAPADV